MKKIVVFNILLISMITIQNSFAHALWIETSNHGKKGVKQEVKIYYGEFEENTRDSVAKWYSDVKELTVWLITPDNERIKLTTSVSVNHLKADFTPEKEGIYTVLIMHDVKEFPGTTRYQFDASAIVVVDKAVKADPSFNTIDLGIFIDPLAASKTNAPLKLIVYLKGQPAANTPVSIFSPSGWSKNIITNEEGIAEFIPLWEGLYLVEAMNTEKTEGEINGKAFKAIWRGATLPFVISK